MRGQLGVEYWLAQLSKNWGVPRGKFSILLITDSKASIDIMTNATTILGIKDTLRADMDVGLEIASHRKINYWALRQVIKVESHIDKEDAPNKFYWGCNELADNLATLARTVFSLEELKKQLDVLFPGTKSGVVIGGHLVNNDLYGTLKEDINGREMQHYLMVKYGWTEQIFESIDWKAHNKQLQSASLLKKVTLIKYIHGWLATNRRRFWEGSIPENKYPLCGQEETRIHTMYCQYEQMKEIRQARWINWPTELGKQRWTVFIKSSKQVLPRWQERNLLQRLYER